MVFIESLLSCRQEKDIWELVKASDTEFVPPLSARESTTEHLLTGSFIPVLPKKYFEALKKQSFVLCLEDDRTVGFLSYIRDHDMAEYGHDLICDYVSTIIVAPEYRNRGCTKGLYRKLFEARPGKMYATRTWSTNDTHIHILEELGFSLLDRIENDRGFQIDTLYFIKEPKPDE